MEPFSCQIQAQGDDLAILESAMDQLDEIGLTLHESKPFSPAPESAMWQTLVVGVSSPAAAVALRSILVELIRSRKIVITIRDGDKTVSYSGPIAEKGQIERLANVLAGNHTSK